MIQVNHSRASGGSSGQTIETRKARYFVVDSVEALAKFGGAGRVDEAWDRVVCVMTTGQEWQFKPYKWKEPKELFHHGQSKLSLSLASLVLIVIGEL